MPKASKPGPCGRPATIKPERGVCFAVKRGPDGQGRWYWQGTRYEPITRRRYSFWCGWKHGADMAAAAGARFYADRASRHGRRAAGLLRDRRRPVCEDWPQCRCVAPLVRHPNGLTLSGQAVRSRLRRAGVGARDPLGNCPVSRARGVVPRGATGVRFVRRRAASVRPRDRCTHRAR